MEKTKDGVVFLTVHDLGSSYMTWRQFVKDTSMEDIRKRCSKVMIKMIIVHLSRDSLHPGGNASP